jgi:mono/diheme cytochrome c family protein
MNRKTAIIAVGIVVAILAVGAMAVSFGAYNFAADAPHGRVVADVIEFARDRSVEERARGMEVPALNDPKMIAAGADHYAEMCTGCHLAPGMKENEMRPGMYPKPPVLAAFPPDDPAEQFWIVKHGIKMSGMPAWGVTHSDEEIWAIVAFLQKLPSLTPEQYKAMTVSSAEHHMHMHD